MYSIKSYFTENCIFIMDNVKFNKIIHVKSIFDSYLPLYPLFLNPFKMYFLNRKIMLENADVVMK